nr:hypothetical protein [uncultured Psychroserpens sp.]
MKTGLAPKHSHIIGKETVILWFQTSNRYVIISESLYTLITVFLNADSPFSFTKTLKETLDIDTVKSESIYNEIGVFLDDANKVSITSEVVDHTLKIPSPKIERFYDFEGKTAKINFESNTLQDLIHPQIAHHSKNRVSNSEVEFDIFKTDDDLHLFKNKNHIGSYKTSTFHLLQGKFALELTNFIHDKLIEDWVATFHASTVTNNNEAIMIIGDSGNGKSTLSALLMANGLDVLTDDFTPLHQDMSLYRYPAAISVKKGAFKILETYINNFETLKTYTNGPKKVNLKYVAPTSEFENRKPFVPCNTIVYVKFNGSKTSTLQEIPIENILETLIPESWVSPNEHHALQFINWLKELKCYELNYSDNDFAISKFKTLFDQ